MVKSIAQSCGKDSADVRKMNTKEGDFGEVAKIFKSSQGNLNKFIKIKQTKPLTIERVFTDLKKIASTKGNKSNADK